jgi:hypothetical protein
MTAIIPAPTYVLARAAWRAASCASRGRRAETTRRRGPPDCARRRAIAKSGPDACRAAFLGLDVPPAAMPPGLRALHAWLDTSHRIGLIEHGMDAAGS